MKVIVTGGAGFIGSHVCEALLSAGHEVTSLDNFNPFYDPAVKRRNIREILRHPQAARFKSVRADIRDRAAMNRVFRAFHPAMVIHLAAMAGVRPSIENPLLYGDVNVKGTQVLLEACRLSGVKHFIFASSSSVYGNNKKVPFSEKDRVDRPISPYAATKKAGELLCHIYSSLYRMNVCVLRFFTVYGPRQRPDLAIHKFTKLLFENKPIPFFGDGTTKRDYTYIDDIVDGVLKALRWTAGHGKKGAYEIFNLGESRTVSLKRMVSCLEEVIGKKARLRRLPPQKGDVARTFADISKARKILGYAPVAQFREGVVRFVNWYRRHAGS